MKRPNVSLLPEELEYLEREGLIERMSGSDYDRHERSLLRVDLLNDDLRAAREEQSSLGRSRSKLLLKHKSRRHQLFSRAKTLAKEEAELKRSKGRLQEIAESIQRINEELGTLETTKKYLATFVRTPYGYMRLSRKGDELLEALRNSDGK
jgi:DNA repair exonuclease SbcCD ATPase subunit